MHYGKIVSWQNQSDVLGNALLGNRVSWHLCGCYFDRYQPQHLSFTSSWQQYSLIPVLFFRKYCTVVPYCKNNLPWSRGKILVFYLEFFAKIFELEFLSPIVFIVYIFVFLYFLITILI